MSIETIERIAPTAILLLALANEPATMVVNALHVTINQLFYHLRVSGRVNVGNQIPRCHSTDCLRDPTAVAVVDDSDRSAVHAGDAVFRIVGERLPVNNPGVAV